MEYTRNEKAIIAIKSLIDGDYDNEYLMEVGELFTDNDKNIETILKYFVPTIYDSPSD